MLKHHISVFHHNIVKLIMIHWYYQFKLLLVVVAALFINPQLLLGPVAPHIVLLCIHSFINMKTLKEIVFCFLYSESLYD